MMMMMMKKVLGAAMLVAIAKSQAFAAEGGQAAVGVGLGATAPASTLSDQVDPSYGIDGFGSWPILGIWNVRVSAGFDRFHSSQPARADCEAHGFDCNNRIGRIDGGLEIAARNSPTRPYGFIEIGAYTFKEEVAVGSFKVSTSQTNLGGGFGGGGRADLGNSWGVGAELAVRWWRQGEDTARETFWYLQPIGFVYYRFLR